MKFSVIGALLVAVVCLAQGPAPQEETSQAPLTIDWNALPTINVNVVKGSVVISNQADVDFDQTVVVEAVNEVGKAFALGYQHFQLRGHSHSVPIGFESKLPPGRYSIHADAVAEVPSRHAIYRQHLEGPVAFSINAI